MKCKAKRTAKRSANRITVLASYLAFAGELRREFLRSELHWRCQVRPRSYYTKSLFFTLFLDLHSSWVYSLVAQLQYGACVNTWSGRLAFRIKKPDECVLTAQVFLPDNNGLHVHHCRRPRRNLLSIAPERFHLHMGRRKCWTKVRPVFWLCCRLVVDHGLDDVYCRQLSSKGNLVSWLRSILTRD